MTAQWMRSPGSGHTQQQGALQAGVTLKTRKVWADSAHWMLYSEEQDLKDIVHHIRLLLLFKHGHKARTRVASTVSQAQCDLVGLIGTRASRQGEFSLKK